VFEYFLLPLLPEGLSGLYVVDEKGNRHWTRATQGTVLGIIFVAVVALVARSVMAAGRRTFAVEKHDGREMTPEEQGQRRQSLAWLLAIFGLVILFWFGYEHNDTLWISFTQDYVDLRLPFQIPLLSLSWPTKVVWITSVAPDQLQFLNALFVIILVPVFNIMFGYLDPKMKTFTPMRKILAGFILTAAAVGIMAAAGTLVHTESVGDKLVATNKVSLYWPAMAYIVLTFGEVLLYGTMLDLSYAAAPKSMKGYVTACFLLTNTLANFLNILWTGRPARRGRAVRLHRQAVRAQPGRTGPGDAVALGVASIAPSSRCRGQSDEEAPAGAVRPVPHRDVGALQLLHHGRGVHVLPQVAGVGRRRPRLVARLRQSHQRPLPRHRLLHAVLRRHPGRPQDGLLLVDRLGSHLLLHRRVPAGRP
jgi:hypothetical protein